MFPIPHMRKMRLMVGYSAGLFHRGIAWRPSARYEWRLSARYTWRLSVRYALEHNTVSTQENSTRAVPPLVDHKWESCLALVLEPDFADGYRSNLLSLWQYSLSVIELRYHCNTLWRLNLLQLAQNWDNQVSASPKVHFFAPVYPGIIPIQ